MSDHNMIDGAPLPSPTNARFHRVVSPKGTVPLRLVFLSDRVTGYWTHWKGMPLPCERTKDCRYCAEGLGSRWTGFAACYSMNHRMEAVAQLTEGVVKQLLPTLEKEGTLLGLDVELARKPGRPNAAIVVKILGRQPESKCPPPISVTDALNRLWGINEQKISAGTFRAHRPDDDGTAGQLVTAYRPRPHLPGAEMIPC